MKFLSLIALVIIGISTECLADLATLENPLFHQGLINADNVETVDRLGRNYPKRNTLNSVWLGVFRRYNSSETAQNRTALESKRQGRQMIFDMEFDRPVDWSKVSVDQYNEANVDPSQYALSLETTNIEDENSPVLLMLLSNQHTILDYLSNNAQDQLTRRGASVAVLEYPGYGVSIGVSSRDNWLKAVGGAAKFLNRVTGRKVYLVGHSIGGPLALQAASMENMGSYVAGAISYGGFTDLYDMAKDHISNIFLKMASRPVVWAGARNNNIDGTNISAIVDNGIQALVLHGELDGAVTQSHLFSYQEIIDKINSRRSETINASTHVFEGLYHEEINNYSEFSKNGFNRVWNQIYESFGWESALSQ